MKEAKETLINILGESITHNGVTFFIKSAKMKEFNPDDRYIDYSFTAECSIIGMDLSDTVTCDNCKTEKDIELCKSDNTNGGYVCNSCLDSHAMSFPKDQLPENY
ncbi:MAG: hypothetical protein ACR2PH_05560 [Desulfobulbia bacterium]